MQALTLDMEIKPEDKLVLRGYGWCKDEIVPVLRVTRTLVCIPMGRGECVFRRDGGRQTPADKWNNRYLYLPTQEDIAKIEAASLLRRTRNEVCKLVEEFCKTAELEPLLGIKAVVEKAKGEAGQL